MGCKSSKTQQKVNTICYTFEKTKVSQLDTFFDKASALLEKAEIVRKSFIESAQESYHLSGTSQLRKGRYIQTIKVLFWSASANCQGQILRSGLKLTDDPPFLSLSANGLDEDIQSIYRALRAHFDVVVESPEVLSNSIDIVSRMNNELVRIANQLKTKKKFSKIIPIFTHNVELFCIEIAKMKKLLALIQNTRKKIEKLMPKVRTIARKADRVGIKAYSKNIVKPLDIFEQYILLPQKNIKNDIFLNIDDIEIDESIHEDSSDDDLDLSDKDLDSIKETEKSMFKKKKRTFSLSPEKVQSMTIDDEDEDDKQCKHCSHKDLDKSKGSPQKDKNTNNSFISKGNTSTKKTVVDNHKPFAISLIESKKMDDQKTTESVNIYPLQAMAKDLKNFASSRPTNIKTTNKSITVVRPEGQEVPHHHHNHQTVESPPYQSAKRIQIDVPERKNLAVEQSTVLISQGEFPRYRYSTPLRDPFNTRTVLSAYPPVTKSPFEREEFNLGNQSMPNKENNVNVDDILRELNLSKFEPPKPKQTEYNHIHTDDFEALKQSKFEPQPQSQPHQQQPHLQPQHKLQSQPKEQKKQDWYGNENVDDDEDPRNLPGENSSVITDFSGKRQHYLINMKS